MMFYRVEWKTNNGKTLNRIVTANELFYQGPKPDAIITCTEEFIKNYRDKPSQLFSLRILTNKDEQKADYQKVRITKSAGMDDFVKKKIKKSLNN